MSKRHPLARRSVKYQLKLFLNRKMISYTFSTIKEKIRHQAKLIKWDKAYLKIIYAGKGENEVFNDMDAFSYEQFDKMLSDFTEKATVDYLQG